jgi:prepilin-type N-terminal cleavage/methylation domain-containing protein
MARGEGRHDDERGFTLVETLVALAILVVILPAMFGVLFTEISTVRIQRQHALDNEVMLSVAEAVQSDAYLGSMTGGTCGTSYSTATMTFPTNWSGSVTQCYTFVATQTSSPITALQSLELVTITAYYSANNKGTSTSVVVVKSAT